MAKEIHALESHDVTDQQLDHIRDILHKYTEALRDFEFIHANRWSTYFVKDIAASRLDDGPGSRLQAALISELKLKAGDSHRSLFQDSDLLGSFNPKLMQHSTAIGRSLGTGRAMTMSSQQRHLQFRLASRRFAFAVIGGLIIVVPMLILAPSTATPKMQGVTSGSIFLFAGGVAVFSSTEPENLLVATAAYAAVLVAFMGGLKFRKRFRIPEIREVYRSTEGVAKFDNFTHRKAGEGIVGFAGPVKLYPDADNQQDISSGST
ncbi:hypothetical protein CEP51_015805, partial [Fusarium floridanum]